MASKLEKLAASPDTPPQRLLELVRQDAECASIVVRNPAVDVDALRKLFVILKSEFTVVTAAAMVLQSASADSAFIEEILLECPDLNSEEDVDYPEENCYPVLLAKHPATPPALVSKLAGCRFYMVRERLAARPDLPDEVALHLAKDAIPHVRRILAANDNVSTAVLDILVGGDDVPTLLKVALNPNASPRALRTLSDCPDETVRLAACSSPAFE